MIRKLSAEDREEVLAMLGKEPARNLFFISDVENFGFDQDFQELWGDFDAEGQLIAVLLRYEKGYLSYAQGRFDTEGFAEILRNDPHMAMLSGGSEFVEPYFSLLDFRKRKQMYFAELKEVNEEAVSDPGDAVIRRAGLEDVEAVCALTDIIEEFEVSPESSRSSLRRTLETGTGRTYLVEREGRVIATASTTAENSVSAMVISVATHPDYRGQGLASGVVTALCSELNTEGKSLCLFYDNPKAASIYKRIGFRDIGDWTMNYR
ncbi:FR47-like protein [compost metagenome]